MFVDNLKLDVIATYNDNRNKRCLNYIRLRKIILDCEGELLDLIKGRLDYSHHENLVKLSLCWECPKEVVDKYKTIQESIDQTMVNTIFGDCEKGGKIMTYLIIKKFDLKSEFSTPSYQVETTTDNLALANKKLVALNLLNEDNKNYSFHIVELNEDVLVLTEDMQVA